MNVLHEDTPEKKIVRRGTAILVSIGVPLSKMAEACGVNARRFQAFIRGTGNLTTEETQALVSYFKKVKRYIGAEL